MYVNTGFYYIIFEKVVDSILCLRDLSSRLYTSMMSFFTLYFLEFRSRVLFY